MKTPACLAGIAIALAVAAPARATFTQELGSPFATGTSPYGIAAADFNGDGRPDVATPNGGTSDARFFLRKPTGGFLAEGAGIPVGTGPNFSTVADFNRDGKRDMAIASFFGSSVTVLLRNPTNNGFVKDTGADIPDGHRVGAVAAGDFDRDNDVDLAVSEWDDAQIRIWLRQGAAGPFVTGPTAPTAPTGAAPRFIAPADFDGDGRLDLAVASLNDGNVTILHGKDGGQFEQEGSRIAVGSSVPEQGAAGIAIGNFGGDARPDFAVANYGAGTVSVMIRQGTGFVESTGSPVTVGVHPVGIAAGDFNSDGRLDFAVANNSGNSVSVMLRTAAGGFVNEPNSPLPSDNNGGAYGVAVADFNADARPDLAVSNDLSSKVSILLNTTPRPVIPPPDLDIDNDGANRPLDCDDNDPARYPGNTDIPGDGIDQDCDNVDDPYPRLRRDVSYAYSIYAGPYTMLTSFGVKPARSGDQVKFRCKGRGCTKHRKTINVTKNKRKLSLLRLVKRAKLRKGAVVSVRVTQPAKIGAYVALKFRGAKKPRKIERCLPPGTTTPVRCAK